MQKKTLILGIGNTIRGDDAIGILLARELQKENWTQVEIKEIETSGFELLDEMAGYAKVIIIDAIRTNDEKEIGQIVTSCLDDRIPTVTLMPSHGFDFAGLVQTYRQAQPDRFPEDICFVLVKVTDVDEFREGLSEGLTDRFQTILKDVVTILQQTILA